MTPSPAEQLRGAVSLRAGERGDVDFIFDSWLSSYRDNNAEARELPRAVYFPMHRALLTRLVAAPCNLRVVCSLHSPHLILAWAAWTPEALHYLYVKARYRGFGLTEVLLAEVPEAVRWFTHRTPKMQQLAAKRGLVFNPYLAGLH